MAHNRAMNNCVPKPFPHSHLVRLLVYYTRANKYILFENFLKKENAMLSDRITTLFELLSCSNTDIARYADCSPSNISRLKSGSRMPAPDSRTITKLAEGIWQYADHENMQNVLCQLTNAGSTKKEQLIPALITWLYDTKKMNLPKTPPPESRQQKAYLRLNFGYRLDHVMKLLGLSNVQLASQLNIDASLVSR